MHQCSDITIQGMNLSDSCGVNRMQTTPNPKTDCYIRNPGDWGKKTCLGDLILSCRTVLRWVILTTCSTHSINFGLYLSKAVRCLRRSSIKAQDFVETVCVTFWGFARSHGRYMKGFISLIHTITTFTDKVFTMMAILSITMLRHRNDINHITTYPSDRRIN